VQPREHEFKGFSGPVDHLKDEKQASVTEFRGQRCHLDAFELVAPKWFEEYSGALRTSVVHEVADAPTRRGAPNVYNAVALVSPVAARYGIRVPEGGLHFDGGSIPLYLESEVVNLDLFFNPEVFGVEDAG